MGVNAAVISVVSIESRLDSCLFSSILKYLLFLVEHFFVEILVVVVASEGLLHVLLIEELHVLLNLLTILVLPLAIGVVGIEVVGVGRNEWSFKSLMEEVIPREVSQPWMVLDVFWTIQSKSVQRLSLNEPVDEVSSLNRPTWRNISPLNLDLFSKNVLSDFPPVSTSVRSSSKHTLIAYDTHGKVVHGNSMRLFAHHLGSHVSWSARGVLRVVRVPHSSYTQISYL